jgi:tetratricopeptide (TPR) repeat protein
VFRNLARIITIILGLNLPALSLADDVKVRASIHADFGRIVFIWSEPVLHQLETNGKELTLRFSRPISASLDRIYDSLKEYVAKVESTDDGRSVKVKLAGDFDAYSYDSGAKVVLEIARPIKKNIISKQKKIVSTGGSLAKPPAVKSPVSSLKQLKTNPIEAEENVKVRAGEHTSYTRLVFDWGSKVEYTFLEKPGLILLNFRRPATLSLLNIQRKPPRFIGQIKSFVSEGGTQVEISVSKTSSARHFLSGPKVVLDIVAPKTNEKIVALTDNILGNTTLQLPSLGQKTLNTKSNSPLLAQTIQPIKIGVAKLTKQKGANVPTVVDTPSEQIPAAGNESMPNVNTNPTILVAGKYQQSLPSTQKLDAETIAAKFSVSIDGAEKGTTLKFDWDEPAAVAVFRRVGYLWIVFDKSTKVDVPVLEAAAGGSIRKVQQLPATSGTVLRMITSEGINPSLSISGLSWLINFKKQNFETLTPIEVIAQPESPLGARIFMPIADSKTPIGVTDPDVGDNLAIVPIISMGHGVAFKHTYPEVRILKSIQGVIVAPIIDRLRVRALPKGIELASSLALNLSSVSAGNKLNDYAGSKRRTRGPVSRVLDLKKWSVPDLEAFMQRKQELQTELATAKNTKEEQEGRLRLARFFFANAFAAEVLGVLRATADTDPVIVDSSEFRLLRGGASYLMHRFTDAIEDLGHSSLDDIDEGAFWRAAVIAKSGEMMGAAQELQRTGTITETYPKQLRIIMDTLVTDAVVSLGDTQQGKKYIEALKLVGLTENQLAEISFIEGQLLEIDGDEDSALLKWEEVLEIDNPPTRYKATIARVDMLLNTNRMEPEDAIEELERLRFVWRGGEDEFNLLRRLGGLYIKIKNYRKGLQALRQAATYYRDNKYAPEVTQEMSDTFKNLYLKGEADRMPPLTAIALYDEFKELTPAGNLGDKMIRNIADRLVKVDLLFKAAGLLEKQLKSRLKGIEKSRVGMDLAVIYTLGQEYEKVLQTLDMSQEPKLPDELVKSRLHLRAQALMSLDQISDALLLLRSDDSLNAGLLRSDLYWRINDWVNAASSLQNVVRQSGIKAGEELSEENAAKILNLATAYTLSGNERAILRIQNDFSEPMAKTTLKKAFDLVAQPLSIGMIDPASIAERVKTVTNFRSFLDTYKERLKSERLSDLSRVEEVLKDKTPAS